jgi:enterochelin esterase-like enzyme
MSTRQVILLTTYIALLAGLSACAPSNGIIPTQTAIPSTATITAAVPPPSPIPPAAVSPSPTSTTCLTQSEPIKQDTVPTTKPPQQFFIYLPPCYDSSVDTRYPVLYLLHGQTFTDDQWIRLGMPAIADQLIQSHNATPFIMVFPDDRYWNSDAGPGFGNRLINDLIPYVDKNYRTLADRKHRALGGLSRGGGWTVQLGFEHPELFGALGLHSPAIFKDNAPYVERYVQAIPQDSRPLLWMDIGDSDMELPRALLLEEILTRNNYPHEFHRFTGDHSEVYWGAHAEKYLQWYAQVWQKDSTVP